MLEMKSSRVKAGEKIKKEYWGKEVGGTRNRRNRDGP